MRATGKLLLVVLAQLIASSAMAENYQRFESANVHRINSNEYTLAYNVDAGGSTTNPELAAFFYHQGNIYYHLDEYRSAINNYNEAISLRPNYPEAYYYRGLAYYGDGVFKKALTDFQTALSKNSFSISFSKLNTQARQKILEIEKKISEVAEMPSKTSASQTTVDANLLK